MSSKSVPEIVITESEALDWAKGLLNAVAQHASIIVHSISNQPSVKLSSADLMTVITLDQLAQALVERFGSNK
jgi:hypothetical protein